MNNNNNNNNNYYYYYYRESERAHTKGWALALSIYFF